MSLASKTGRSIMSGTPATNRATEIGKKKFLSSDLDVDSDNDDDNGESYSIMPSVPLWKTIDFKNTPNAEITPSKANNTAAQILSPTRSNTSLHDVDSDHNSSYKRMYSSASEDGRAGQFNSPGGSSSASKYSSGTDFHDSSRTPERKIDESVRAAQDRDDLLAQLEVLQMQNEMLARRMERSKEEAEQKLEEERKEREQLKSQMESENKRLNSELLAAQAKAEADLLKEKHELSKALLAMEKEKSELLRSVKESEEKALHEAALLQMQRDEFRANLVNMEDEKRRLESLVAEKEALGKTATEAVAKELQSQREELLRQVRMLEAEKNDLSNELTSCEQQAKEHALSREIQLEQEKNALTVTLTKLEADKNQLSAHLLETERSVQLQAEKLAEQLASEKDSLVSNLEKITQEKNDLALKLSSQQSKISSEDTERQQLQAIIEAVNKQKEELANQLKSVENIVKDREKAAAEQLAKEKEELLQMVMKMKEELDQERAKKAEAKEEAPRRRASSKLNDILPHDLKTISEENAEPHSDSQEEAKQNFANMPAPHAAAAGGDIDRLKTLGTVSEDILQSFDANHRSPLFYSAAYDKPDVLRYLIDKFPELCMECDDHGDTPLHAAISCDSYRCVEIVLETLDTLGSVDDEGRSFAGAKNKMKMTPAHLAASVECLDALYQHGADLTEVDINGRSPLFVACAMNRWACAEYLISCLDQETSSLYIQDDRGDTPLHAAACNGAVDCLLLLLQSGVDPTVVNKKGHKPVDLAIKNKHKECQKLLAEYHLHYCTSSDFDSVLFLATLQGHKQAKTNIEGGDEAPRGLKEAKSYFSLKKNKTMKVQRWGAWIAYVDPQDDDKVYWYNQSTNSGQWDMPAEVSTLKAQAGETSQAVLHKKASKAAMLLPSLNSPSAKLSDDLKTLKHSKMSMRLKKIGDWIHYVTEGGRPFYYNEKNGDFQWECPASIRAAMGLPAVDAETTPKKEKKTKEKKETAVNESVSPVASAVKETVIKESASPVASAPVKEEIKIEEQVEEAYVDPALDKSDWRPYKDPESGALFWYNEKLNISQWECPFEDSYSQQPAGGYNGGGDAEINDFFVFDEEEHHEAEVVHGLDDLGI